MRNRIDIDSNDNALFVTAQCNNRCIMCCQPPLHRNDLDGCFGKNMQLIDTAPVELRSIGITGGEPTLLEDRLFDLIRHIRAKLPQTEIHLLTNARAFADKAYARKLASCGTEKILLGIPLHSDYGGDHDAITRVKGSFEQTMLGLYHLARYDFDIELRVVITKMNYRRLPKLPDFIYRNLPFVAYIALMGLEYTGYAVRNRNAVWIDPMNYVTELTQAVMELRDWHMDVSVFNLPRCVLPEPLWPFARKSISDWKTVYPDICRACVEQPHCCGLFATSRMQSKGLKAITPENI